VRPACVRERSGGVWEASASVQEASGRRSRSVRQTFGCGTIFMINISQAGIELVRHERGLHAVRTAARG
jgi:hypothetical protein